MEGSGSLRKQVLVVIDSMRGKKGAKTELGRAAEKQDWGNLLDIWKEVGDVKAIALLTKDILEEEKEE